MVFLFVVGRKGGVALPPPSVYEMFIVLHHNSKSCCTTQSSRFTYSHTRERKEQKLDRAFINTLHKIIMIVPVGTIILQYGTLMAL
jgi:hypothetical protein